jgi:hypothetical protein
MDEERKRVLEAGIYLGDVSLALASLSAELPSYVKGLDIGQIAPEGEEMTPIKAEVAKGLADDADPKELPPGLLRITLERAIDRGKFLSAIRCLEMLGEKEAYIEGNLESAKKLIQENRFHEAVRALVVASNLDLEDGLPLFQYSGSDLHRACTTSPEACITRAGADEAVLRGLKYLVGSEKVGNLLGDLSAEVRRSILPYVVAERDPNAAKFLEDYGTAHTDLEDIEAGLINDLREMIGRSREQIARLSKVLDKASPDDEKARQIVERARRTIGSLGKEFAEAPDLVEAWQIRRIRRRFEHLIESRADLEGLAEASEKNRREEISGATPILDLIDGLVEKGILEDIDRIEERLLASQVTMLGRKAHSQEHWQFLREISFKYPVSPLVCCVRRMNDRWMVVPQWDSEIARILRDHLAPRRTA